VKFGPVIARRLRRYRLRPSDRWHLDEMVVRIAGKQMYLWRAVDHEGEVLDMLVQRRRDSRAALRLVRKLLRKQGFAPKLLVTDKLRSYASAFRQLGLTCRHEQGQSGREFVSGGATARAQAAKIQISPIRPVLSEHACCRPQYLQPPTSSRLTIDAADLQSRGGGAMVKRCRSSVKPDQPYASLIPRPVTVTKRPGMLRKSTAFVPIAVGTPITGRPPQSGRIEARTGLRMMPTSPRSPLSFRTAGFPQYGWKDGISDGAFPTRRSA